MPVSYTHLDVYKRQVQSLLADEKVDSSLTVVPGMRSTASIALAVPGRDKSTTHLRGAAPSFCAEDFTAELFRGAGLFLSLIHI